MSERDPPSSHARGDAFWGSVIVWIAGLVCFFFATTLRDVRLHRLPPPPIPAPPIPLDVTERDAELSVTVVDEQDQPVPGASVRVFVMREGKAYFAGDRDAGADGRARLAALPRGEVWVLAYAGGKARASTRAVLEAGAREARLVLRPARALDLVVVDESEKPVEGASIEVITGDPLPYSAITAADGTARVDRLGPPPYRVRATARGYDDVVRTGVVPAAAPLRIRLERLAALAVAVVLPDGSAAAGATVLVAGTGLWPARSTLADDGGNARISGLHGGVYDLKARLGDRVSATEIAVPVKRGETKEVKLTLQEAKRVAVTVTDGEGDGAPPLKDASVVLAEEGLSSFPLQGKTNAAGVVELGPIARDVASVAARAQGFVPRTIAVPADAVAVRVGLQRGGALVGDVVDDRGFPVAGATIEVVGVDGEGMPIDETTAMIDFRDARFEAALPGPRPLIPMGELGVMPGPVPDFPHLASGSAEAPAAPTATPTKRGDPWVTRADGNFRAEPIPPGRVHAIVRHPAYVETVSERVTIRSGGEAKVHVVLRQGGWIEGRVLEEDRTPVRGARIELAATGGSLERVTYAADDGTFTFASAPDEVLLSVSRPEAPSDVVVRAVVPVPDRDRQEVEITLPRLRETVSIHVADDRGYPVDRVEIRAVSLEVGDPLRRTLFTNAEGDAELRGAAGLPLRIALIRPGKSPIVEQIASAPDKLSFTMNLGVEGRGEVTGRGGRERLAGADVTVFTPTGARHLKTDDEGAFAVKDLAPGRIRIAVAHADYAFAEAIVNVVGDRDHPANLGTIDLSEAGEVEGTVVDADDQPVAGARVALDSVPTYLPLGPLPRGIVATDREGRFTLGGLPDGRVSLQAFFVDLGRGAVDDIPVRAGRTTTRVKIVLPGDAPAAREPKGAGSVALTLAEHTEGRVRSVLVAQVPPGSEGEVAGIEPGDEIVSLNGRAVHSIEAARKQLTGPLGEDVVIEIRREDAGSETILLRVRRERVRR